MSHQKSGRNRRLRHWADYLYADKAYIDAGWALSLKQNHTIELLTPRKKQKGDPLISGDTFSTFVRETLI